MQDRRGEGIGFGPVTEPGKAAGDCPECGDSTVMIGYESTVVATLCEDCNLLIGFGVDHLDVHDAFEDPHPEGEPASADASLSER